MRKAVAGVAVCSDAPHVPFFGFEYYRHGTLSLYAALDTKTGRVHGW